MQVICEVRCKRAYWREGFKFIDDLLQMSQVYDNWERLVRATLRREQLRLSGQRTPSDLSLSSTSSLDFPNSLLGKKFEYDEILRATNSLSQSNLIKHGRSGDLFGGVLENGASVVIKRIKLSSAEKELYCMSELKVLSKLSNCRLVPLLGHCLENDYNKYLIYKYMPNGALWSHINPRIRTFSFEYLENGKKWRRRLKIATGLAEALSYLHHQCVPPLVHRDIQASSILLDHDFEVRLCSLGDVCTQESESNQTRITRFLDLPQSSKQGTSGTSNATCAYDVYCFGKVLLELVANKLDAAADSSIMEYWMNKKPYFFETTNPTLAGRTEWQYARGMTLIANACLHPDPSNRPLMAHVLMALKDPFELVNAGDMASYSLRFADKTIPKRSKSSMLGLGTLLRTKH